MRPPPRASRSKTANHTNISGDKPVHTKTTTRKSKAAKQSKTREPPYHLFRYFSNKIAEKHEKFARDEYQEDLKVIGEGFPPQPDGYCDRESLEGTARRILQTRLEAVAPAIAKELQPYEELMISEFLDADRLRKTKEGKEQLATRAVVARAFRDWPAKRNPSGLPVDGDCDDLDPGEIVREQEEGSNNRSNSDPTAEQDPATDMPAMEKIAANNGHELMDSLAEDWGEDMSASSVTLDGVESPGSGNDPSA